MVASTGSGLKRGGVVLVPEVTWINVDYCALVL